MSNECRNLLDKILSLSAFDDVLSELEKIDKKKTSEIKSSLQNCIKDIHSEINKNKNDKNAIKYLLYKESVKLHKVYLSSYLSYSEMMATRENTLWKFAFNLTEQFFDIIADALDDYFNAKIKIMNSELEKDASWYTGIRDTTKRMGSLLNLSKKILDKGLDVVGLDETLDNQDIIDTQSIVEKLLNTHLDSKLIAKDISKIMKEANKRYKECWEKELKVQAPDLSKLKAFANYYGKNIDINIGFELGAAEQAFAVGITGAIVGTIGLSAGWHTITYAMLNVFPPIAIFAILGTVVVAVFTKEKALEYRKKQVREAVKQFHRHFLLQIEVEKLKELKNKSLREAMIEQSQNIIKETVKQWCRAISGELDVNHYRLLISAFTKHLMFIDDCIEKL